MRLFILFLVFALLLQTTLLGINLCLVLIVARSLAVSERSNLIAGFFTGIFLGAMSSINIGFYSILFVICTKVVEIFKGSALSGNFLSFIPLCFIIYMGAAFFERVFLSQSVNLSKIIWELFATVPTFLIIKFMQERFTMKPGIKLRVKS